MKQEKSAAKGPGAYLNPEEVFLGLFRKIPGHIRLTFVSALVFGLLTHLYMFTNKLPNHDDIGHIFGSDYGAASGRWLLPIALRIHGSFSLPWAIGILALVFLGLAACFTVSTLRIRRPLGCLLTAALMVSFPSVAATMAYMFSADVYFLSLLLACFAAFLAVKLPWGWVIAILPLTLSMGIYQSYFSVAAVLLVGALLFDVLDEKLPLSRLLLRGLSFAASLGASMGAYLLISKLASRATGLVDYMGISEMGKLPLSRLPELLREAYRQYSAFFLHNQAAAHADFMNYFFVLAALASLYLLVFILLRKRPKPLSAALLLALVLVYPLAGNLIVLMAPDTEAHLLMVYGLLYLLLLPLALMEYALPLAEKTKAPSRLALSLSSWILVVCLAGSAYSYVIFSNEAYLKMQLTYEQMYSFSTRLLGAIEGDEAYSQEIPIVFVGESMVSTPMAPELDTIDMTGAYNLNLMVNSYTYPQFLQRFLGLPNLCYPFRSEPAEELDKLDEIINLPIYPNPDAILLVDNQLVVKLGPLPVEE